MLPIYIHNFEALLMYSGQTRALWNAAISKLLPKCAPNAASMYCAPSSPFSMLHLGSRGAFRRCRRQLSLARSKLVFSSWRCSRGTSGLVTSGRDRSAPGWSCRRWSWPDESGPTEPAGLALACLFASACGRVWRCLVSLCTRGAVWSKRSKLLGWPHAPPTPLLSSVIKINLFSKQISVNIFTVKYVMHKAPSD